MSNIWILVGVVVAVVGGYILLQNNAYSKHEHVKNVWQNIDAILVQRNDAIKQQLNLLGNVISSESKLGKEVAKYRSGINEYTSMGINEKIEFQAHMGNFIARGLVQENYPELKLASEMTPGIMREWNKVENEITNMRKAYNRSATNFNIGLVSFPSSFFYKKARLALDGTDAPFKLFEATEAERKAVDLPTPNWGA